MNTDSEFSFWGLRSLVLRNRRLVFTVVMGSLLFGTLLYVAFPPKFIAETVFILRNPLYADRNNVYNSETRFIDYFANEDDIDKLITLSESDVFQNKIIRDFGLAAVYKCDTTDPEDRWKLKKIFAKRLTIYRSENKNIVLLFSDKNARRAADIANVSVSLLEKYLRGFYNDMRSSMYYSLMDKINTEDSTVKVLTDSLVGLRKLYGIYDIISPSRSNLMLGTLKDNGREGFGAGIETIQNIESVKDEQVSNRARHITLANQYYTGTKINEMPLTRIVKEAIPPVKMGGINIVVFAVCCAFLGFFFSLVYLQYYAFSKSMR